MTDVEWPSLDEQLSRDNVPRGTALERLIRKNQNFEILEPEEAADSLRFPPWLRVYFRTQHPELEYRTNDPTGGYPRSLTNLYLWMLAHPDEVED